MLPIDPRDRRVIDAARHHAALRYIELHHAQHLDEEQLLIACTSYLMAEQRLEDAFQAHAVAIAALADYQARTLPAWVDISHSTAFVIRVVDPVAEQVYCFTAAELARLGAAAAQERTGNVSAAVRRHRCRKTN